MTGYEGSEERHNDTLEMGDACPIPGPHAAHPPGQPASTLWESRDAYISGNMVTVTAVGHSPYARVGTAQLQCLRFGLIGRQLAVVENAQDRRLA